MYRAAACAALLTCASSAQAVVVTQTLSGIINSQSHPDFSGWFSNPAGSPDGVSLSGMRYTFTYSYELPAIHSPSIGGPDYTLDGSATGGTISMSMSLNGYTRTVHDGNLGWLNDYVGMRELSAGTLAPGAGADPAGDYAYLVSIFVRPSDQPARADEPLTQDSLPATMWFDMWNTSFHLEGSVDSIVASVAQTVPTPNGMPLFAAGAICLIAARSLRRVERA